MRSGARRTDRNVLLSEPRGGFGDPRGGVLSEPLQNLAEVAVHVDLARPKVGDRAVHDGNLPGAELGPAEV